MMKHEEVIQKEILDMEYAIYKGCWLLPKRYFTGCKRLFLLQLTIEELFTNLDDFNIPYGDKDLDYYTKDSEKWEIHYYNTSYNQLEYHSFMKTELLISFRHKVYLPTSKELKIALVTPYDEAKQKEKQEL